MPIEPFLSTSPHIRFFTAQAAIEKPLFSIVIPTWNNLELLKVCVASLKKNSKYSHQIVLHINEGEDGTADWAESQNISFSHSQENIGICYAMNIARSLVQADYLVYFNDDMYACPDWDYWLYEAIKQQPTPYFFLSSTMIEPRYTGNSCALAPYDFGSGVDNFNESALLQQFAQLDMPDWNGATWPPSVLPVWLWDMVGGYSTELSPGMYSDPDFSMKLWHAGVREFKGVGKSRAYHFMSKSSSKLKKKRISGAQLFLNKWGMSSNVFTRFYLKRGAPWQGTLTEPAKNCKLALKLLLNKIKQKLG